ncbi:MAG: hypothetical protein EOM50_06210, partial [Erysipelotrichia bacterium]|nr:hypothetical protein [Erysipelotrichia bacterium]
MENKNNKENKKSNKIFNIFLAIAVLGTVGYTGYRLYDEFWSKGNEGIYEHANTEKKSGRKIDYFDLEEIEKETDRSLYYTELEREPYKENTLSGGQMVITSGSGYEKYLKEINGLYDNGEPAFHSAGTSLRHPEDELVDPEQTLAFNTFVSYTKALDDNGQETKL